MLKILYIYIVDKTADKWYVTQFATQLPKTITEDFINELTLIQPPFESSLQAILLLEKYREFYLNDHPSNQKNGNSLQHQLQLRQSHGEILKFQQ